MAKCTFRCQKQRMSLARGELENPKLLLRDEPLGVLDPYPLPLRLFGVVMHLELCG